MAMPAVVESAPDIFEIVPPVLLPPTVTLTPSPFTMKLPDVFFRRMPLVPLLVVTLPNAIANGVVPLARVISTAAALVELTEALVLMAPLVTVIVLVLSVPTRPF